MKRLNLGESNLGKYYKFISEYIMIEKGDYYLVGKPGIGDTVVAKEDIPKEVFKLYCIYQNLPEELKGEVSWAPVYTEFKNQLIKVGTTDVHCPFVMALGNIVNKFNWGYELNDTELFLIKSYNCLGSGSLDNLPRELESKAEVDLDNYLRLNTVCSVNGFNYICSEKMYDKKFEDKIYEILYKESFIKTINKKPWEEIKNVLNKRAMEDVDGNIVNIPSHISSRDLVKVAYINFLNSNYNYKLKKAYKIVLESYNIRVKKANKVLDCTEILNPTNGRLSLVEYDSKDYEELVVHCNIEDKGNHYKVTNDDKEYLLIKDGESEDIFKLNKIYKGLSPDAKTQTLSVHSLYCNCNGNLLLSNKCTEPTLFGKYMLHALVKNFQKKKINSDELFVLEFHGIDLEIPKIKYNNLERLEPYKYRVSSKKLNNGSKVLYYQQSNGIINYYADTPTNQMLAIKNNIGVQLVNIKAFRKLKRADQINAEQLCFQAVKTKVFMHDKEIFVNQQLPMREIISLQFILYLNHNHNVPYTEEVMAFARKHRIVI